MRRRAALTVLASAVIGGEAAGRAITSVCGVVPGPGARNQAPGEDWTPLFNGRDLSGWDTFLGKPHASSEYPGLARAADGTYTDVVGVNRDPRRVFSVVEVDGGAAIRISGETYGGLISQAEYGDYHLRLEFKWGTRRWPPRPEQPRDTGCCYHSVGPHGASYGFWMKSFEFQIQEGDVGDFYSLAGVIVDVRGTPVDPADPRSDIVYGPGAPRISGTRNRVIKAATVEKPAGEWNTLDLYCLGQQSVHVVNGHRQVVLSGLRHVIEGREAPLTRGRLQLQSEAAEVFFRNIAIRRISAVAMAALLEG
ncbi:DUF1080 domain-containing protein [Luteitalea sp. TBR-22]|uniref:3-keto-disaccharide hydrolase n=1 Tax=Luteitalea sp. TBR-22 TaxID=2802971 RepID=UPI001EF6ECA5|nr:DUF1080 domain-containing protein [Luteitalea sp. TBR-22]